MKGTVLRLGIGVLAVGVAMYTWVPKETQNVRNGRFDSLADKLVSRPGTVNQPISQATTQKQFMIRGVIEGFYGNPWTLEQRKQMFDFMSQNHYNTYVYAPKDDPYQRLDWSQPYPFEQALRIKELVQAAGDKGIQFVYSISPGIPISLPSKPVTPEMEKKSITFSAQSDRYKLLAKVDQLREMGVHAVMLSFDDVKEDLKVEDQSVYGSDYARAQMDLANELLTVEKQKDQAFQLWFAPTIYYGLQDNEYWQTLRSKLDPSIQVIWTGPAILSKSIDSQQADQAAKLLGRMPLIWDNFPVNDYTYEINKRPQLIMGPIEFRSADLYAHTAGVLVNPMIQPEASKPTLYTYGKYLHDPDGYDPNQAWQEAIQNMEGVTDPAMFAKFAEYARNSILRTDPTPHFISLAGAYWNVYDSGKVGVEKDDLRRELELLRDLPKQLHNTITNQHLLKEVDPWVTKLGAEADAALLALEMVELKKSDLKRQALRGRVEEKLRVLQQNPLKIGEEVFEFAQRALTR